VDGRLRCFDLGVTDDSLLPEVEASRTCGLCVLEYVLALREIFRRACFQTPRDRLALSKETLEPAGTIARNPGDGQTLG
jgi:hypothetical protein